MNQNDIVTIPIEVENFLSLVLGKQSTHGLSGHHSRNIWRKYLRKLITHFEKHVRTNVITDNSHNQQLIFVIAQFKNSIDSKAEEAVLITSLFRLCFLLLGDMPNHWRKKIVNRPEHFMLDRFRSVHYSQSPKQKADLIMKTYIEPKLVRNSERADAEKALLKYHRYNRQRRYYEFIEWFRGKYPDKYLELFS